MTDKKKMQLTMVVFALAIALGACAILVYVVDSGRRAERQLAAQEAQTLQSEITDLQGRINDLKTKNTAFILEKADLEGKVGLLQDYAKGKTEQEAALRAEAEKHLQENKKLARALSELTESAQKRVDEKEAKAKSELAGREQAHAAVRKKLLDEISALQAEQERLVAEKKALRQRALEFSAELKQAQREVSAPADEYDKQEQAFQKGYLQGEAPPQIETEALFKQHYNQGVFYDDVGKYTLALREYKSALELKPDDPDTHYNIAILYDDHLINKRRAILHYRRYLELRPDSPDRIMVEAWLDRAKEDLKWDSKLNLAPPLSRLNLDKL